MLSKHYFITAIGTDSGKTLASAILTEALRADYWKPVQAGAPSDSETVQRLISNPESVIHKEAHFLSEPMSPHAAAERDGVHIDLEKIILPKTDRPLIIEGAGGILVPLNKNELVIDLAVKFNAEIILVSNYYLGSINHTLLTAAELKRRGLPVKGIIFNGSKNTESKEIILHHAGYDALLEIEREENIDQKTILNYARKFLENNRN